MNETIREIASGLNSGGAAFALLLILILILVLATRAGRVVWSTVWPTVVSTLAGFLAEFRRSNDITAGLHGKIDTHSAVVAGEHERTRAHVTASHAAIIREVHARGELTEQVVRERASAITGGVRDELRSTGEHAAVTAPEPSGPPRRTPTLPRMPSAPR